MARSFLDLIVYQNLYKAMITVLTKIVPKLPREEKFDLGSQMRRACKAPPALIAEGYAKKHHKKEWQKYLNDAIDGNNLSPVERDMIADNIINDANDISNGNFQVPPNSGTVKYRRVQIIYVHGSRDKPVVQKVIYTQKTQYEKTK